MMAPAAVGWKKASSMVLWPRKVTAEEALTLGLCSEVVTEGELETTLRERIATLAERDRFAVMLGKAEINSAFGGIFGAASLSQLAGHLHSREPEVHKKMRAYQEKLGRK